MTALTHVLREGWIGGAALDVFVREPLPPDHALHGVPNLMLTPHHASLGYDSGARMSTAAAEAMLATLAGKRPDRIVNPEVLQSPALRM
ncbi:MAG: D-3-phosphoglycerate dehydrogenase [Candidatus Omnitrophota bacterium]|jgi:D-3-phosphoglycerate dehydrogenase / 2-oxoglutarate reductase